MRLPFPAALSQHRILGGAAVLAVTQLGASLAGLVRDRVLATTFPGLEVVDVYIAAFRPSDLLFQVFIMAGFSVALVPLLARHHAHRDGKATGELLSGVVGISAVLFGVIGLLTAAALPSIAHLLVDFEGGTLAFYIDSARLALVSNFLFVFGNAYGHYLITVQRYWIYGITPILYTLGTILGTVYLTPVLGPLSPMYGTLIGGVVYVALRLFAVFAHGYRVKFSLWHPDIPALAWLAAPRMLALGVLQLQLLLFDGVASGLDPGSVTINAYARNFQSVAVGIAGIALAQSVFSLLSQAAARGEGARFAVYLRRGTMMLLLITIPGAIALVFLTETAATLVGLRHVLPVFSGCLALYALSIPFESLNHLLLRAFYATRHSATPAIFSVVNGFSAIITAWVLAPKFGIYSLAIGFTLGQIIELIGLGVMLPWRIRKVREVR